MPRQFTSWLMFALRLCKDRVLSAYTLSRTSSNTEWFNLGGSSVTDVSMTGPAWLKSKLSAQRLRCLGFGHLPVDSGVRQSLRQSSDSSSNPQWIHHNYVTSRERNDQTCTQERITVQWTKGRHLRNGSVGCMRFRRTCPDRGTS